MGGSVRRRCSELLSQLELDNSCSGGLGHQVDVPTSILHRVNTGCQMGR